MIWRVVNSSSSFRLQLPKEGTRQEGTNFIYSLAAFTARVRAKSSLTAPFQWPRTSIRSNVERRIAIEPPHAKLFRLAPSVVAIDPFHAERSSEAKRLSVGINQR